MGAAFRDIAKDSRIGASAAGIDQLSQKLTMLGKSMQASGGMAEGLGGLAMGIGALLSPATLGAVTLGILGKQVWDFNKEMTATNATLARNAELSNMSTKNLWAMGQAAKTVGGDPAAVQGGIASLQTSLAGMSIGVGSAIPQMIGIARLHRYGARFNKGGFGNGVDEESLFKAVSAMYQSQGRAKTMAFVTGYGLMSPDQANLAMAPGGWAEYKNAQAQATAMKTGGGFDAVVRKSLQSQVGLGEKDIAGAIAAETAYGGIQGGMQTITGLVTNIYGVLTGILNALTNPKSAVKSAYHAAVDWAKSFFGRSSATTTAGMSHAMKALMGGGMSESDAAAMVGNMMQESAMDPLARNASGHVGLMQWDKKRQAAFAKRFGYPMGTGGVPADKQFNDELTFAQDELRSTEQQAASAMAKALSLIGKTSAFMNLDERAGDNSLSRRVGYAQQALMVSRSPVQHTVTSETNIGDVHLHTNATDPAGHVAAFRNGLSAQPLLNPNAQGMVALATRANY